MLCVFLTLFSFSYLHALPLLQSQNSQKECLHSSIWIYVCSLLYLTLLSSMWCSLRRLCSTGVHFPRVPLSSFQLNPVEEFLSPSHCPLGDINAVFLLSLCPSCLCLSVSFRIPSPSRTSSSHVFNGHPHADDLMHIVAPQIPPLTSPTDPTALGQHLLSAVLKGLSDSICPNPNSWSPSPSPSFLWNFFFQ